MAPPDPDWFVVVPVKGGDAAKTRLVVADDALRAVVAMALARDTVAAAVAGMPPARVLVVTADPDVAAWAARLGAESVDDPGGGLDAAATAGAAAAYGRGGRDVAVLLGDHPALRPEELAAALSAAGAHERAVVPDAEGTGTALLSARGVQLRPRFGPGSAGRHERAGATRLELDLPGLRQDVDDLADLRAAHELGVGPSTRAALPGSLRSVQASIHTFDDDTGGGSALLDDGRTVDFGPEALADSGLRFLRPGQRVSLDVDEEARRATRVWIVGIGDNEVIR
jgi:2-phospho-L-lactate guanylyltransferase